LFIKEILPDKSSLLAMIAFGKIIAFSDDGLWQNHRLKTMMGLHQKIDTPNSN